MEITIRKHINIEEGTHLLDVRLTERPFKAYLVANLAFLDGPEASAEHYGLSLGAVYAAMSFYEDNRDAIQQALDEDHQALWDMGMIDGKEAIENIKKRK